MRLATSRAVALGTSSVVLLGHVALTPGIAAACSVCFGRDANWAPAFVLGTIIMLGLPPLLVAAFGIAVYRAMRRKAAHDAALETMQAAGGVDAGRAERTARRAAAKHLRLAR
jgi:hypothetical protein